MHDKTAYKTKDSHLIAVLESLRTNRPRTRVRVYYDSNWGLYGRNYDDGYVDRTTGQVKAPILVYNSRSYGGFYLDDDRIIKIVTTREKMVLWARGRHLPPVGRW